VDDKLKELIKNNYKKITTPVCAFITFTTQEAYERCNRYLFKIDEIGRKNPDYKKVEIMTQKLDILKAPDPTNIVWKDLGISGKKLTCNNIKSNLLMSILVLAIFFGFWFLKTIPTKA